MFFNFQSKKKREGLSKNMHKGHMDKAKGGGIEGGRWGWLGSGKWWGEKWRQLYLNNNKKEKEKEKKEKLL